ncbi:glycoside hydrolase family 28 protein [Jaapia argillacea MUCL 33604]|uniref:galacturonan 1,4-alpha-galacturonidase n=1 Tax=Jaapia argillacea MUCL 33604 TaxID=933084 RepID=A0A067PGZ6_9AGAM|nr:glycoside hydrolase family 28 protein [Jaapia argillacea MUCL 33604]
MAIRLATLSLLLFASIAWAWPACTVVHNDGQDDTPNVYAAVQGCPAGEVVVFAANTTYNMFTPLNLNASDVTLSIQGNLSLPTNITAVQAAVNASTNGGYWLYFGGSNVTLQGSADPHNGWIDSHGQQWWDANNTIGRPILLGFNVNVGYLYNLKVYKPIAWAIELASATNIYASNTLIDASSTGSFPFNTDGFIATGSNIVIEDSIILNGDDAINIGQNSVGTHNVTVRRAYMGYSSHGCSIGSLGRVPSQPANVSNILFENVFFDGTLYGARFKSWVGGTGLAKNVTFRNFGMRNVSFPLYLSQTYIDQNNPGPPRVNNASVIMEDFTYENFYGDINTYSPGDGSCISDPCWWATISFVGLTAGVIDLAFVRYYEPDADGTQAVIMRCNENACSNFTLTNINLHTQSGVPATTLCNYPPVNSTNLGFLCANGTFTPT